MITNFAWPCKSACEAHSHGSAGTWLARLQNGDLLASAETEGFDVLVTSDKRIEYQQNLERRKIAIVVLTQVRWGPVRKRLVEIATQRLEPVLVVVHVELNN